MRTQRLGTARFALTRVLALLAVIATTTLLACDGTPPTVTLFDSPVDVSVSPAALSLIEGGLGGLSAQAFDANGRAAYASFEWSSADPAIATVDKRDGTVTAISAGTTTVTATAGALTASATVSVRPPDPPVAVFLLHSEIFLIAGGIDRLIAYAYDYTGQTTRVSFAWSSADPTVATVDEVGGIVTAIKAGVTTVTAAVGALSATATVSVIGLGGPFDGSVAFTRTTQDGNGRYSSDVLLFSADDQTTRSLPRADPFTSIGGAAWSTDGTRLAVEVIHGMWQGCPWLDYNSDLYVLDAAAPNSPWRALTTNGLSKTPSWSPDGTRIAYVQHAALFADNDIYVIDVAGGTPRRLTSGSGWYSGPRWSPDGTRLAFTDWNDGNGDVFIINADGTGLTNVTRSSATDFDPSWAPDGARLAFVSDRDNPSGTYHSDVFVIDADGRNVRRLASLGNYSASPAWSPDGRQIAFSLGTAIYAMGADGSSLVRISTPSQSSWDSAPVWRR